MSFAGIDLGTTTSGICIPKEDRITIVDMGGKSITPSFVCYEEDGSNIICGEAAKNRGVSTTNNVVFDVKRLIGRKITDASIQTDLKHLPYKIKDDGSGNPIIELKRNSSTFNVTPVEVSSEMLKFLVNRGKEKLGRDIDSVVITVPANFDQKQREATKKAGEMAGLNVLGIMNEPTAAAYAYGFEKEVVDKRKKILIYDFGGGTFDISIIEVDKHEIKLIGSGGESHLGGVDIDILIADYFNSRYKDKTTIDLRENPQRMKKLIRICEEAKIILSQAQEADIDFDDFESAEIDTLLTRPLLNKICGSLFERTLEMVKTTLSSVGLTTENITDVVLIGGSSKIPKIQEMLNNLFTAAKINKDISPDEAVTMGAGLYAQQLYLEHHSHEIVDNNDGRGRKVLVTQNNGRKVLVPEGRKVLLQEIVNKSIGIAGINPADKYNPIMKKIVPKNSPVNKEFEDYFLSLPNTTNAIITVYEGENDYAKNNTRIDEYNFSGFPPSKDGTVIRITCKFDLKTSLLIIEGDAEGKKCTIKVNVADKITHG